MAKDPLSERPEDAKVIPGEALKKIDPEAHEATYTEDGTLLSKHVKPVAAVIGGTKGTAETGVSAKVQEPVGQELVNPADTVPDEALRGDLAPDHTKETVEVHAGVEGQDVRGLKTGDVSPAADNHEKIVEKVVDDLNIDKTQAAKESEKSVKEAQKREDSEVAGEPAKKATTPKK